ncbi:glycosyl hydrolase family 28-related protein [Pseudooceanicola sp.]|uniref:glycosyl hydrolase family 28-related protein n=1 Tax=Pseudooceanicola sp. TaxID=1914328 RepID=UPI00260A9E90|nr:glycosyl hydrolase family 28-related protein [Pseudooceanicola sp.]MDF1854552.1 glycosyl hydrolase family 28-related protein [Pseudooceanicola sp.]
MNKAITDGIVFMPPAFSGGLAVWSKGDGTPGSDTYAGDPGAAYVPADADFAGCLELLKGTSTQKLRYMGETPILPGCYLRISARVKAMSGNLPNVRIAGWAGGAGDVHVAGLTEVGPSVTLTQYGEVVEISAIVGSGDRQGVDMVWGNAPLYGHFGLDLTGANGGVVRIDDITIEDVTEVFLRTMLPWVDVRDYGAKGDGSSNDLAAFQAADATANGRLVMVSEGSYFLGGSLTMESRVQFEGTVSMATASILSLTRNFDLPSYIDAFGDEELAFKKAFQSLLNDSQHESLDMGGRRITVTGPIDMAAAVANKSTFSTRRHIANGQFDVADSSNWDDVVSTSQASYSPSNALKLTGVVNVANVRVGSLVTGNGVGREVYVRDRNIGAQEITLSAPLYDAAGTQTYTFTRFQYLLDFSGFDDFDKFSMSDIEFRLNGRCSGILLAPSGLIFHLRDCVMNKPKDRGLTSHGEGCQGMLIDRCQFLSDEGGVLSPNRVSVALNANANDVKLRDNRIVQFRHFAVLAGTGTIITGNHWFQGDDANNAVRLAGLVLTHPNTRATINGNYVDNCFIEWANEHDASPAFNSEFSFSGLSITDNIFLCSDVAPWFTFIVVKPHGTGHFLNGLAVTGNIFRTIHGLIDRVESVDTSFADLDYDRCRNVTFSDNMFNNVSVGASNPLILRHDEATEAATWDVECAPNLPFGGWAQTVESLVANGKITRANNTAHWGMPYVKVKEGAAKTQVTLNWEEPVKGTATVIVRMDDTV